MPAKHARIATAKRSIDLIMPAAPQSWAGKQDIQTEFLPDGAPDCPILRLFGFQVIEMQRLQALCFSLANGSARQVEMPAEPVSRYRLTLSVGRFNKAIVRSDKHGRFECVLTSERWQEITAMLAPFCGSEEEGRFQWPRETSEISLLLSQSGQW